MGGGEALLDMRAQWRNEAAFAPSSLQASARTPALGTLRPPAFGRRRKSWRDLDLIVDLAEDSLSLRWWRGVATLSLLSAFLALIAPSPFDPLPAISADQVGLGEAKQYREIAIAPLSEGSDTGFRMAANSLVEPLAEAPDRPTIELFARFGSGDDVAGLLTRAGAGYAEAGEAARLIGSAVPGGIAPGTSLSIRLGRKVPNGTRPIERIAFRATLDLSITLTGSAEGLRLASARIAVDNSPLRIRGRVGDGLYWALRASGVSSATAGEYLRAIAGQIDVGGIGADDRFDLIVANRRAGTGESQAGPLLYAAIDRAAASDIRLVKWSFGGRTEWVDANSAGRPTASAMAWPVAGRITSGFGVRVHPILRFARFHRGIDFGAGYGAPIVAASDGQVVAAGWSGGYGRQVRIAHGAGIVTTYSHMSRTVAEPGSFVRQGQLIGYVGSSGLSTGPHLHYEVYRNGTPVNPLGVRFAGSAALAGPELERFKARLAQLMAIGASTRS